MQLLKPAWVSHDDRPIFSIDIHPKGGRFVTGGQGSGDAGRIVIWNLKPLLSEEAELDPKVPKMLCQLDNHLACVNIVRWSSDGTLLASGGDDKLVMVWKYAGAGGSAVFGARAKHNVESWRCTCTLNCHSGDVLDLAWAPHDRWLASCSVDNTVIVWNAGSLPEKVAVLKGHTGLVKGVAWDPVGKYLASQSDDRTLRVWRTADWAQQVLVTEPFEECSGTTHVLRLSWSPDGQYLVSAHAMNGGGPTAQIIERDGWKQDKDFVGHRKAVTCVRFNSNILSRKSPDSSKKQQYCCLAIGSRDRSLSVWLTSLKRPLAIVHDLFTDSVLDLSWSSSGLQLLACSWDGSVAFIDFSPDEIGRPLTHSDKNALYERIYGKSIESNWSHNLSGSQIVESPEMLEVIQRKLQPPPKPVHQQQLQQQTDAIKPSKETVQTSPPPQQQQQAKKPIILPATTTSPINKQIETRRPDGKRRITPLLLMSTSLDETKQQAAIAAPQAAAAAAPTFSSSSPSKSRIVVEKQQQQQQLEQQKVEVEVEQTAVLLPPPGSVLDSVRKQRLLVEPPLEQRSGAASAGGGSVALRPLRLQGGRAASQVRRDLRLQVSNEACATPHGPLARLEAFRTTNTNTTATATNSSSSSSNESPLWDKFFGSAVCGLAFNRRYAVVCCADHSLHCYLVECGAPSLPPLMLDEAVVALSLSETHHLLVLTKAGLLNVWDLKAETAVLHRVPVYSLLADGVGVSSCCLSSRDTPLLTLTNGQVFGYNVRMRCWARLFDPSDAVASLASASCPPPHHSSTSTNGSLPLANLQKQQRLQRPSSGGKSSTLAPPGAILSHLERQMAASRQLGSDQEHAYWLLAAVGHLLEAGGPEAHLRHILDQLMQDEDGDMLQQKVMPLLAARLAWQRLYNEYADLLSRRRSKDDKMEAE